MKTLIADSGSTKTHWALVIEQPGLPKEVRLAQTVGLNPLYSMPDQIVQSLRTVLNAVEEGCPDELRFYGSGCSGERIAQVEHALRTVLTPRTRVMVQSDLLGAALALQQGTTPFISCIMGTGSIAALFNPVSQQIHPMPALGYILGDEGSGAWFGRHLLGDYLKGQMPAKVREAFEDDFGRITAESAIQHVYQLPAPNRYLANFANFLGHHSDMRYSQELGFRGVDAFWRRNILPIAQLDEGADVFDVRFVGSAAYHLRPIIEQVAESYGYFVSRILKDPIEGLI